MALATASIDDPETWHLFANLDNEFLKMVEGGVQSRFHRDDTPLSLPEMRAKWDTVFRKEADLLLEESKGKVSKEEISISVRDGSTVRALVYRRTCSPAEKGPLFIILHGGGFRIGNAEMEARACIGATQTYGCVSVSLEYRLSPENKFPVAYDDAWDALLWLSRNDSSLGADVAQGFVFGGTSAGAHMVNALVHRARDEMLHPPLTGVYLNVPPSLAPQALTDEYRDLYRSREALKDGFTLTSKSIELYDRDVEPDFTSPLWSPLLWPTGHANLPPTFFQICGADLLRDDGLIYERELRLKCGGKTRIVVYNGLPHVFWYTHPSHPTCEKFAKDTILGLGWLLGKEV